MSQAPSSAPTKNRAHRVAISANDKSVYANLIRKSLAQTISSNPHLLRLAEEAVMTAQITGATMQLEYNTGRSIGYSELIATTDSDVIFYAQQSKSSNFTRFVKNRQTVATSFITLNLVRDADDEYEITDMWIGTAFPATPNHAEATPKSAQFWADHAVVYNGQPIVASSLTKTSPF